MWVENRSFLMDKLGMYPVDFETMSAKRLVVNTTMGLARSVAILCCVTCSASGVCAVVELCVRGKHVFFSVCHIWQLHSKAFHHRKQSSVTGKGRETLVQNDRTKVHDSGWHPLLSCSLLSLSVVCFLELWRCCQQSAESDNNIHRVPLAASEALSKSCEWHSCRTSPPHHWEIKCVCVVGGGGGLRHAAMQISDRTCHVKLKACAGGSILVSLEFDTRHPVPSMHVVSMCSC